MSRRACTPDSFDIRSLTTQHAQVRSQQRGIAPELIALLLDYGQEVHIGQGSTMLSFPRGARERLRRALPRRQFAAIASKLDAYAVLNPFGHLLTVGHRYQPVRIKH